MNDTESGSTGSLYLFLSKDDDRWQRGKHERKLAFKEEIIPRVSQQRSRKRIHLEETMRELLKFGFFCHEPSSKYETSSSGTSHRIRRETGREKEDIRRTSLFGTWDSAGLCEGVGC